jgi:hypothetical protein
MYRVRSLLCLPLLLAYYCHALRKHHHRHREHYCVVSTALAFSSFSSSSLSHSYVKQHINEVVKLPVDLNCLSSPMLKKLASLLTVQVAQALRKHILAYFYNRNVVLTASPVVGARGC